MLKANELRIGNWVGYATYDMATGNSIIVPIIVDGNLIKTIELSPKLNVYHPIPLTTEILEKCGLNCVSGHYWELSVNIERGYRLLFFISLDNNAMGIEDSHGSIINIKLPESLHKLQNTIFSLTGEELNYKP